MRISTKLVLCLTATVALILGAYGIRQFAKKRSDLKRTAEHELRLLATAVQVGIQNAVRDGQPAVVQEVLESLELKDSALDVFVFNDKGELSSASFGSGATRALVQRLARDAPGDGPRVSFSGELEHLVSVTPLHTHEGATLGYVGIVRPLDELREDLADTAWALLFTVVSLIAAITVVGAAMVFVVVGRPLSRLQQAIDAVRSGDRSSTVPATSSDELSEVTRGFNRMVKALEEAETRVAAEMEARHALVAGLQHVDKLAAVGQLSAGLAHEIGSPLQILSGRARAIAERQDAAPDIRRSAQILVEQVDRITRIVEQLLGFARRKAPRVDAIALRPAVMAVVDLVGPEARRRGVAVETELPAALPKLLADEGQVQQVTLNLLTNALRACSHGARLKVQLTPASFSAVGRVGEVESIALVVRDEGAGIAEEQLSRIFEPFFTTWGNSGGTGLGLAVVRAIVEEHGGHIEVRSELRKGTEFKVHFPVKTPIAVGAEAA